MTAHLTTLADLSAAELLGLLDRAEELKALRGKPEHPKSLAGKSVAVLLEKASTRTRLSFEVAIFELGGLPLTMISKDTQLGRGEPLEDTARMLSRYVDGVVFRTFGHERIETLTEHATIPVINGLSDAFHPCQVLADLMTVREELRNNLEGVRVAWIGDGNNMAHSWILAAGLTGLDLCLACPSTHRPAETVLEQGQALGAGRITITDDPKEAAEQADVVTTDVWASMGQEEEAEERQEAFKGFMVDEKLMAAAKPGAIFLHCLPAHRGEEVSAAVIDGAQSRVWDEAENRLHVQKALLEHLVAPDRR